MAFLRGKPVDIPDEPGTENEGLVDRALRLTPIGSITGRPGGSEEGPRGPAGHPDRT